MIKTIFYYIVSSIVELFAFIAACFLLLYDLTKHNPKGPGPADHSPILLIHGYFLNSGVWCYMRSKLMKAGFTQVYTINLGSLRHTIDEYAQEVQRLAEQIAATSGREDLILIGHSMGGLVALQYAKEYARPHTVTDIISLASPFEGTHMAVLGSAPCAAEMRRESSFQKTLKGVALPFRFFHCATQVDFVVIPWQSALFYSNKAPHIKRYTYKGMSHLQFVFSPNVANRLIDYLQNL